MKHFIFLIVVILHSLSVFPQGEFNNWRLNRANLTFNTVPPSSTYTWQLGPTRRSSAVSDSLGNLLFYVFNNVILDRLFQTMPNSMGINGGGNGIEPVFTVKKAVEDSIYYVFTVGDLQSVPFGLEYSMLDMRLRSGYGDIIAGFKNLPVTGGENARSCLTGTRHGNNKDVWIVTRKSTASQYLSFLIDNTGIHSPPVISQSTVSQTPGSQDGELVIARDGTKMIYTGRSKAEFSKFNVSTGVVTPLFKFFPSLGMIYQYDTTCNFAEFSKESHYLYVTAKYNFPSNTAHFLYFQYDATLEDSTAFMQSEVLLGTDITFGCLQLAPDGKIYIARNPEDRMHVIHSPSSQGLLCQFDSAGFQLVSGGFCSQGLPQYLEKYYAFIKSIGVCTESYIEFIPTIWPPADSIRWNFGDPASGGSNVSYIANPSHLFSSPGTYTVELYVRHNDNRTDTSWQTITIVSSPLVSLGPNHTICTGSTATFDAGFCSGCVYEWKDVNSGLIVGTNQTFATGTSGIYCVNVTNGNGCTGKDTVQLITTQVPVVTNGPPLLKSICTDESTNIPLFGNEPGIMFHWTATLTSGNVTGFTADSGLVINQILINNGATAGVVTYHITPKIGDCAGTTVDYAVTVNVGDPVDLTISASVNAVCAGTLVTYTATAVNAGTSPVYQWQVNGVNAGSNAPTFAYAPVNGDIVTCILTSSNTVCTSNNPATSNAITMLVNPIQPVSVTLSPSANPVCSGTTVTFTAMPVNGGSNPSWQWKVNGLVVGSNVPVYAYVPINGDAVTCTLTSNVQCPSGNPAISGTINMAVNPNLPVGVSIVATSNPFCAGLPVTYTAYPVNGGTTPAYQWKVNGINAGSNSPVLTYSPTNGDVVICSSVSSETCTSGNPAQSNPVTMVVNANLPAGITIAASANPFCPGSPVNFTANPVNGGSSPVYQWKVNGINTGSNSSIFIYSPVNNDSVRCILTSNLNCVTGNPVSSAKIIMNGTLAPIVSFTSCFDTVTTVGAKAFKLKGGIPLGGTYSGPGVNGMTGIFTPSVAGTGLKTILYTYTNVASCSAGKSKAILVQPNPVFTCGNSFSDIRDGQSYQTVQIGTQCWMAANLNYGSILNSSQVQNDNCISEKYCYNDVTGNCTKYGGLYQWDEVMKYDDTPAGQGLCPPAWHVPTDSEWTILFNFYQGHALAGKPLQDTILSGFKAQTSGVFYLNSSWSFNGFATLYWSSTPWSAVKAISHGMNIYDFSVSLYPSSKVNAFPIRCAKD
jgi:uncharacterized protein (TIGR02145 family)